MPSLGRKLGGWYMTLWGDKGGSSRFYRKPTNLCEIQLNGAKSRAIQTGYHATRAYVNPPPLITRLFVFGHSNFAQVFHTTVLICRFWQRTSHDRTKVSHDLAEAVMQLTASSDLAGAHGSKLQHFPFQAT